MNSNDHVTTTVKHIEEHGETTNVPESAKLGLIIMSAAITPSGEITSYNHEYENILYTALPNLYCVMISRTITGYPDIVGAMMLKTNVSHNDAKSFEVVVQGLFELSPALANITGDTLRFLPARLGVPGVQPITENEALQIIETQMLKYKRPAGNA